MKERRLLFLLLVMQCVCFTLAVVDDKSRKNSILEEMKKYVSCGVKKQSRTITAPGCEDKEIKVSHCSGKCLSYTTYQEAYPHFALECSCCKASKMKVQAVLMKCGAAENGGITEVKLIDEVDKCECRRCQHSEDLRTS